MRSIFIHGSRDRDGLYLHEAMLELAEQHSNFHYNAAVSQESATNDCRAGRADELCA